MSHNIERFTAPRFITAEITATAVAQNIGDLIATRLSEAGFDENQVQQVIIMEKVAAGTDRGDINIGEDADHMNLFYGAGIPGDPPSIGTSWHIARNGVADVPAIAMILMAI